MTFSGSRILIAWRTIANYVSCLCCAIHLGGNGNWFQSQRENANYGCLRMLLHWFSTVCSMFLTSDVGPRLETAPCPASSNAHLWRNEIWVRGRKVTDFQNCLEFPLFASSPDHRKCAQNKNRCNFQQTWLSVNWLIANMLPQLSRELSAFHTLQLPANFHNLSRTPARTACEDCHMFLILSVDVSIKFLLSCHRGWHIITNYDRCMCLQVFVECISIKGETKGCTFNPLTGAARGTEPSKRKQSFARKKSPWKISIPSNVSISPESLSISV